MLKKVIYRIFLFVFLLVGTAACVCVVGYGKYINQSQEKNTLLAEESVLTSLLTNVTNSKQMAGTINISSTDGKTAISGDVKYLNNDQVKVQANISGKFNNTPLELNCFYISDVFYLQYENIQLSFTTSDFLTAFNSIFNTVTSGELSSIIDVNELQKLLDNVNTTAINDGYRIDISVPNIGNLFIYTNAEYVPYYVCANNITLSGSTYNIFIELSPNNVADFSVDSTAYKNITLTDYAKVAGAVVDIINKGGISLSGTLVAGNNISADISLDISTDLSIRATIELYGITATVYYIDNYVYVECGDNYFRTTLTELSNVISKYFSLEISDNLSVDVVSDSEFVVNESNNILFKFNGTALSALFVNGENFAIELNALSYVNKFSSEPKAITVSEKQITTIIDKYISLINETDFSISLNGKINNIAINGIIYISIQNNFTEISRFVFKGTINNVETQLTYVNSYYYLLYDGIYAKFSQSCISDLYSYFATQTSINYIDLSKIVETIKLYVSKVKLSCLGEVTASLKNGGTITVSPRANLFSVNINNLAVSNNIINLALTLYPNNTTYNTYITNLNSSQYVDYSQLSKLVVSAKNTLTKASNSFAGQLSFSLWDWNFYNIDILVKTKYSAGKLTLTVTLSNLPTTALLTKYNIVGFKNHKLTLTISDSGINMLRTVQNRFTGREKIELNEFKSFSSFSLTDVANCLGLNKTMTNLLNKATPSTNNMTFKKMLNSGAIKLTDSALYCNLLNFGLSKYITTANVSIIYNGSAITQIEAKFSIINILNITLCVK